MVHYHPGAAAGRDDLTPTEPTSVVETPVKVITKLVLSRQVDALNTSERPPPFSKEGRTLSDAQTRSLAPDQCCRIQWRL